MFDVRLQAVAGYLELGMVLLPDEEGTVLNLMAISHHYCHGMRNKVLFVASFALKPDNSFNY